MRANVRGVTDSKRKLWGHLLVVPLFFWGVCTWSRFGCGISRHDITTCHTVMGGLVLVQAGISSIIGSRPRGLLQVLVETSSLTPTSHGILRCLAFQTLHSVSEHVRQGIAVSSRCIVSPPVSVSCAKAISRGLLTGGWACILGLVGTWSWCFKHGTILGAGVQGVLRGAILAITVDFDIRVIAWSWAAVILVFSMADTKWVSCSFVVNAAGIMGLLSHQTREGVAWPWAAVHGSDGATGFSVVVHHFDKF